MIWIRNHVYQNAILIIIITNYINIIIVIIIIIFIFHIIIANYPVLGPDHNRSSEDLFIGSEQFENPAVAWYVRTSVIPSMLSNKSHLIL